MKFGGTSVGSRERLEGMAALVAGDPRPKLVVVSAMGDTTDRLLAAGVAAERGEAADVSLHVDAVTELALSATSNTSCEAAVHGLIAELSSLLQGVQLLREQTPRSRALLASFGERISVHIAANVLVEAGLRALPVDARAYVVTDANFEEAQVDFEATRIQLQPLAARVEAGEIPVVTGFLGRTVDGLTTVLGRSGSDYTASLIGGLLNADEVVIWTDVDGILTADPRRVSEARTLSAVSYREAAEMSYFGAKVIHPKTMGPVLEAGIPIRIRSAMESGAGTVIGPDSEDVPMGVKTVTSVSDLVLLTVQGRGIAGLVGTARRIFGATERSGVNVMMISQASSEQSVSLVVRKGDSAALVAGLTEAFALEIRAELVEPIAVQPDITVVSIVGAGMSGTPGVSGRLFSALGTLSINVRAIAQGASELSISVAVDSDQADRAVRAVHTAFGLTRIVHVALLGVGTVGSMLLEQLPEARQDVELRISLVANSRRMLLDPEGIPPDEVLSRLASAAERPDDNALIEALKQARFTDTVVVDLTATESAPLHEQALSAGFHVVTANKKPLSGSYISYRALVDARDAAGVRYGYETTFGAGLPVLHTLKDLLATGDTLLSIEGCFSGTLGFLCSQLDDGVSLAVAVADAASRGFTEPDPTDDLSGMDVARKALIIARALGRSLELGDIELEPFVAGLDRGLEAALQAETGPMASRVAEAKERGEVLRYVATIGDGVRVGLQEVPAVSPIGSLRGPDNILVFTTRRYQDNPLVVRGPGAGAEVTAAGVLGDILRLA